MVHLSGQATTRKRAGVKEDAGGEAHEIGSAVDLGITVSIYGPHTRFVAARSDDGIAPDARCMRLRGPDTWTTEH
jgi:hypothetical protein